MLVQWLAYDGNTVKFDTVSQRIYKTDSEGVVVEPVRDADATEIQEYYTLFPQASAQELQEKQTLIALLQNTLIGLRAATQDGVINEQEFISMNAPVQQALLAFSQYGRYDEDVNKLAFLILTQVAFAYSFLLGSSGVRYKSLYDYITGISQRVDDLE